MLNTKIDLEHQKKFNKVWQNGNYRQGSTAQRMSARIMQLIPDGVTINDYGCGTGRAEVELLKTRNYKINMIDIAENALEDEAKAILNKSDSPLSFIMADLSDLAAVPHAEWGMCINVLMTVQPGRLDAILSEIRRTCDNLIFEAYDFSDKRLGWEMTTVKKNRDQWQAVLKQHWDAVQYEPSPESGQRYIFVCSSVRQQKPVLHTTSKENNIQRLQNKYAGHTCYIVGRGASLLDIDREHFGAGPVIVINEAIYNIAALELKNDIYSQWRNGDLPPDVRRHLKTGDALILFENPVPQYISTADQYLDYSPLYMVECRRDLNRAPQDMFSHAAAFEIAVKIFGCNRLVMIGFDSYRHDDRTVLKNSFVQSEYRPGDYSEQVKIIMNRLADMPQITAEWFFPAPKSKKLNIGCGDVPVKGYINIDLHVAAADVRMDALHLDYADGTIAEIFSSHLLEHFGKRDVPRALKEWHRVLQYRGRLSMNLPNLEWCLKNWLSLPEKDKYGLALDMIYGLQTNDGEYHKTGFTCARLEKLLADAGYSDVTIADIWSHEQSCFQINCRKNYKVTAITLTGDRPEAFSLCRRWMEHQTRRPDQWIVVDDGQTPLADQPGCYIRREPQPADPAHTMLLNMGIALERVEGDVVLIMEDDEYYAPGYIAAMVERLARHEVVGIGRSKYYNVQNGSYLKDCNMDNASLAQTAFRSSFIPEFKALLAGDQYIDMRLWKLVGNVQELRWNNNDAGPDRTINGRGYIFDDGDNHLYVGIKGMPGRNGIGWGHLPRHPHYKLRDQDRKILRRWMGADAECYTHYFV